MRRRTAEIIQRHRGNLLNSRCSICIREAGRPSPHQSQSVLHLNQNRHWVGGGGNVATKLIKTRSISSASLPTETISSSFFFPIQEDFIGGLTSAGRTKARAQKEFTHFKAKVPDHSNPFLPFYTIPSSKNRAEQIFPDQTAFCAE